MIEVGATPITIESCESFIGRKCRKTSNNSKGKRDNSLTPKPFKSGNQVNTIRGVIVHPILNIPAFTFEEDESYVEARRILILDI